jgi:hypothetical protein
MSGGNKGAMRGERVWWWEDIMPEGELHVSESLLCRFCVFCWVIGRKNWSAKEHEGQNVSERVRNVFRCILTTPHPSKLVATREKPSTSSNHS